MFETGIDILRAAIAGAIFLYLRSMRGKGHFRFGKGWILILIGFGLIFFGALLDITDNFPSLDKYIIIGKTKYADFLEEVVGYLFGFVFVAIGFWKWMPAIVALREEETALKKSKEELQLKIEELTAELNVIRVQLEQNKVRLQEGHVPT
jgi:uncharacterized membrane protein